MKHIAILCGGSSYEHEVSIITGMQVAQALDKAAFTYSFVYFDKNNNSFLIKNYKNKKDFNKASRIPIDFVKRDEDVFLLQTSRFNKKVKIDVCYLAFHGGSGESGPVQGMLELLGVPCTSTSQEGSVISMNKSLTKEVLRSNHLPTLPYYSFFSEDYLVKKEDILETIKDKFNLPVIIKPVHLGSSIGISIAHDSVELEKFLNVAVRIDSEILIESALQDFREFNVSLRTNGGRIELSPIEEPKRADEILSFDDKYSNGSKKIGGKQGGGMELLDRTIPAKISAELAQEINTIAIKIYKAARLSGLLRIDFMYHDNTLYCSEINPIPGSMSFYMWEATGEQFKDQITKNLEDALKRFGQKKVVVPYETDIVSKFIGN